jgi:membrane-bound serine protease (ClpP class)
MPRRTTIRRIAAVSFVLAGLVSTAAQAQTTGAPIVETPVEGVIDGFIADHVARVVADAERDGAAAVVLRMDTPGGLSSAMDRIVGTVLNAEVPVLCWVGPSGARAASAGAIILLSCPVASMAPGTNVGAATPIGVDGGDLADKVTNDAAAQARALAQRYGRDEETAASFVTEASSLTDAEALEAGVIDTIAPSVESLLAGLDGASVMLGTGETVTLSLDGPVVEDDLGGFVGFLHGLFDPSLAFLFFWLGVLLLVLELIVPGHILSGTVGTILLVISLWSFGLLPVRWIGIVLLLVAIAAFVVEITTPGFGLWGAIGIIALLFGGWFLYDTSGGVQVSPWALFVSAGLAALFFGVVVAKAMALGRMPPAQGPEAIIGREGVAIAQGVSPDGGIVRVAAEEWQAVSPSGPIPAGAAIRVTSLDGLVLTVEGATTEHEGAGATDPAERGG